MEMIGYLFKLGVTDFFMGIMSFLIVGGCALVKRRSFLIWSLLALLISFLGTLIILIVLPNKSNLSSAQRGFAYMIGRFFIIG